MFTNTSKSVAKLTRRFAPPIARGTTLAFALGFLLPGAHNSYATELQIQDSHKQPVDDQHILTTEKFQELVDQTVDLTPYHMTSQQAILINSNFKETSKYSTTATEFFRHLADMYTLDIPKSQNFNNSYFLSFPGGYQGIVTTIGKDYEFSLTLKVHHNSNVGVQGLPVKNGVITRAKIQQKTGLSDQKETFFDQLKKVAGEVNCTWNRTDAGTNLTVNSLSVFPYIEEKTSKGSLVRIEELDYPCKSRPHNGLIAFDFNYRLNKIEVFLERFAFEIAKVDEIILKPKSVDSFALDILKEDNGHGIFFKKIKGNHPEMEEWYHLKSPIADQDEKKFHTEEEEDNHSNLGRSAGRDIFESGNNVTEFSDSDIFGYNGEDSF